MANQGPQGPRISPYVGTLLVGAAAGALAYGFWPSHQPEEPPKPAITQSADEAKGKVYASLEKCIDEIGAEKCVTAFNEAQAQHDKAAPRYGTLEQCQAEFGPERCRPNRDQEGHSWFVPALMGVMVGQMLSGGQRVVTPVFYDSRGFAYYGGQNGFIQGSPNGAINFAGRPAYAPPAYAPVPVGTPSTSVPAVNRPASPAPSVQAPAPSEPVARGGFGATGAAKGASGSAGAGE